MVGVDGSACSLRALEWAMAEALRSRGPLEVVLVWSDPWGGPGPPSLVGANSKEGRARIRAQLGKWVADARALQGAETLSVSERVVTGDPARVLVESSASARMLVVGTTGLSGFRRLLLGSVSERCAQLSHVPVVLVPPGGPSSAAATGGD